RSVWTSIRTAEPPDRAAPRQKASGCPPGGGERLPPATDFLEFAPPWYSLVCSLCENEGDSVTKLRHRALERSWGVEHERAPGADGGGSRRPGTREAAGGARRSARYAPPPERLRGLPRPVGRASEAAARRRLAGRPGGRGRRAARPPGDPLRLSAPPRPAQNRTAQADDRSRFRPGGAGDRGRGPAGGGPVSARHPGPPVGTYHGMAGGGAGKPPGRSGGIPGDRGARGVLREGDRSPRPSVGRGGRPVGAGPRRDRQRAPADAELRGRRAAVLRSRRGGPRGDDGTTGRASDCSSHGEPSD